MASGSKMSASESLQSYLQATPTPVTTSRSTPTDRGYGTNLPATRRTKKKEKERDRKQRRRAEVRRDLAEEKQPDAATDEPTKEKIRAAGPAAAANTPTHEDAAGAPCRAEEDACGKSLVSTKTQRKEDTDILVVADVVPRLENQSEGAATGGALAKPMIQVATSVTKLMNQVSVPVAKPMSQAAVSVAGSETVGKPVSDLEVDMAEAVETPVREVELELEMEMAVAVEVAVAASSPLVLTKATVDGDNANNRQALLSWERLGSLLLQRMNQEEERKQSGGAECLLGRNKVTAAVEAAGIFAEEAAAAAAVAEEAAAVATAAAAEAEAVEREENALEGVAAVAPSSSPSSSSPSSSSAAAAAAAAAASQSSSSSPSSSSPTATGATGGGDNADEQQALLTREPLSIQCRTADECLDPPKAGTAADAAEKAAEVAAAAAAVAMTAVAAAEAAMAAVVERDLKAEERARLEEKLLQQVTDELKNRAAEKAAVAKMFALIADDGDGSHDSESTYMGESSRSSLEDEEVQSAATGQSVVYLVNVGGTCYPINAPPIQQQQQQHECGSQCLAYEQCVEGLHSIQAQYADAPHDAMTKMAYSYVDHVGAETCSMPGPLPMQPQHQQQQQQQQHQQQQQQQTSGGVYLENVGGTFYPVMDMCCSSEAMEYVEDVDGICPFPGPSYYTQQQGFEVVDNFEPGSYPRTADVPEENYPTTMTYEYEGTSYPYWMQ